MDSEYAEALVKNTLLAFLGSDLHLPIDTSHVISWKLDNSLKSWKGRKNTRELPPQFIQTRSRYKDGLSAWR
jgi:hypothetical protein